MEEEEHEVSRRPPDPAFEKTIPAFEPMDYRVQLPVAGEIVARGKMRLRPPAAAEQGDSQQAETESEGREDARGANASSESKKSEPDSTPDPPSVEEERVFTEVRLDAVRGHPTWDRSPGGKNSIGEAWPTIGYVLRYREKTRRRGFRKLLHETFPTVPHALHALAQQLDIPDEALVPSRAWRIRQGLSGTVGKNRQL